MQPELVYLWAISSTRLDDDPFLSFRDTTGLTCLLYKWFGLTGKWFNTQPIRIAAAADA